MSLFYMPDLEKEEKCPFCLKSEKPQMQLQHGIPSLTTCLHCGKVLNMYGFAGALLRIWRRFFPPRPVK